MFFFNFLKRRIRKIVQQIILKTISESKIIESALSNEKWLIEQLNKGLIVDTIKEINQRNCFTWGDKERVHVATTAYMANTLFNTNCGDIFIGEYTFTGHNVCIITGSHDYNQKLFKRQEAWKKEGNDIIIGEGVWLGTNSIILGPNKIGDNAVIASGAVVTPNTNIPPNTIYGGCPAKLIKRIEY